MAGRRVPTLRSWIEMDRLIELAYPIRVAIREGVLDARRRPTIRRHDLKPRSPLLIEGVEVSQAEYVDHLAETTIWSREEIERMIVRGGIDPQQIDLARVTPILVPR